MIACIIASQLCNLRNIPNLPLDPLSVMVQALEPDCPIWKSISDTCQLWELSQATAFWNACFFIWKVEIIWDYTSWGYCKLEHIKRLEQCVTHGKHVNNILFATIEYVLQATVRNCSGSNPELNQIKVRASSSMFMMRLAHVELCMELFYGKTSTLNWCNASSNYLLYWHIYKILQSEIPL